MANVSAVFSDATFPYTEYLNNGSYLSCLHVLQTLAAAPAIKVAQAQLNGRNQVCDCFDRVGRLP
jgi:hypothetical protein